MYRHHLQKLCWQKKKEFIYFFLCLELKKTSFARSTKLRRKMIKIIPWSNRDPGALAIHQTTPGGSAKRSNHSPQHEQSQNRVRSGVKNATIYTEKIASAKSVRPLSRPGAETAAAAATAAAGGAACRPVAFCAPSRPGLVGDAGARRVDAGASRQSSVSPRPTTERSALRCCSSCRPPLEECEHVSEATRAPQRRPALQT